MSGEHVVIGLPHAGAIEPEWLVSYEQQHKPVKPGTTHEPDWIPIHTKRMVISRARNTIAATALAHWRSQDPPLAPHDCFLAYWDDDILLPDHDALLRLLSHRLPVCGGLYVVREAPFLPVAGRELSPPGAPGPHRGVNLRAFQQGLQEVDSLGTGLMVIRRDVLEALAPERTGAPWFNYTCRPGPYMPVPPVAERTTDVPDPAPPPIEVEDDWPEDFAFCERARLAGFPIVLDFSVWGHHLLLRPVTFADTLRYAQSVGLPPLPPDLLAAAHTVRPWPPEESAPADAPALASDETETR